MMVPYQPDEFRDIDQEKDCYNSLREKTVQAFRLNEKLENKIEELETENKKLIDVIQYVVENYGSIPELEAVLDTQEVVR